MMGYVQLCEFEISKKNASLMGVVAATRENCFQGMSFIACLYYTDSGWVVFVDIFVWRYRQSFCFCVFIWWFE